jgi:hypothetical protein
VSHNEGYISLDAWMNVFEVYMRDLDEKVMPVGALFDRTYVMHHFENLKHEVVKRAVRTLKELAVVDPRLAGQIDASTRLASSDKPLAQQVQDAKDMVAKATAPTLDEQLRQRRSLGKEVARREALGLGGGG